jgi:hypothetical protein
MQVTDTHQAVKEFTAAGFSGGQAETLSSQQERTAQEIIAHLREAFRPEFARLEARIEATARDQLFKFMALAVALAGASIAIIKLIP